VKGIHHSRIQRLTDEEVVFPRILRIESNGLRAKPISAGQADIAATRGL